MGGNSKVHIFPWSNSPAWTVSRSTPKSCGFTIWPVVVSVRTRGISGEGLVGACVGAGVGLGVAVVAPPHAASSVVSASAEIPMNVRTLLRDGSGMVPLRSGYGEGPR